MNWLCKIGIHRPLSDHHHDFIDQVSGKTVFNAVCSCGKKWMVDSLFGWFGFKVEIGGQND
jgi:hypothetical protein